MDDWLREEENSMLRSSYPLQDLAILIGTSATDITWRKVRDAVTASNATDTYLGTTSIFKDDTL